MSGMTYTIAQDPAPGTEKHYTPVQRAALRDWAAWTGLLILGIMLFGAFVLIILGRERRQILRPLSTRNRKPRQPRPDGWSEAGKRLDIRELGTADDDTVDMDPDELGPGDVDEGPDSPPPPPSPQRGGPNQ